ncbi:MAG: phospholipase D family protein [Nanoarchaeota archaeon]|nr:phospholipase D family protein [Nanoarchaeota archaeon]
MFRIKVFDSKSGKRPYSTELIHSKIYVIDEEVAFVGSANFTYSGFKTHYETMIKIKDKKAVHDISKEIEDLYNSKELRVKEIKEWLV